MIRVLSILLTLPLLSGCLFGVVDLRLRGAEVEPIEVGFAVAPEVLAARLASHVDGLGGYEDRPGYGTWVTAYGEGNRFPATLSWNSHVLTVEVAISEDASAIRIEVIETVNLAESGGKIHRTGVLHVRDLRQKIEREIRAERLAARTGGGANEARVAPPLPSTTSRADIPGQESLPSPLAVMRELEPGRYHALVIGNNAYDSLPGLRTAIPDAAMIGSILELDYGFDVQLLTDADRSDIVSALNGYRSSLTQEDNLLVYYAGHGWYDDEASRGYWLPVDAEQGNPSNWLSNATITDMVRAMPARHVMIVADSCYSGTLTRGIQMRSRTPNETYFGRLASKRARTAMTSGGLEPVEDGTGRHSVFASAFADALRSNRGPIDGQAIFAKIRRPVMVGADQTPEYGDIRRAGHEGGDFLFVRRDY